MPDLTATDVVIIGAGVTGCSIAYHLSQMGVRVLVIERAEIAAEASSAAAGLLSPLGNLLKPGAFTDLAMASWSRYAELIPMLEEASGVKVSYHRLGSLRSVFSPTKVEQLRQNMNFWREIGWQVSWLTGDEARKLEPLLGPSVEAAVHATQEGSILAPRLTRAYAEAARRLGAQFVEYAEVVELQAQGSRVTGVRTADGQIIACQQLVLAAGAWSGHWSEWLKVAIPVSPVRGQILSLRQPEQPLQFIHFSEDVYLIPKPDNTIYIGATIEHVGFDKHLTAGGIGGILNNALRLTPGLEAASIVNLWTGLRPGSADGHPILGRAPGWENVVLATGHAGMGFELSSITGQTISELIITGKTPAIIQPFGVERFLAE